MRLLRPEQTVSTGFEPVLAPYRLVGFEPDRIPHIHEASHFLGNSSPDLIDQVGEALQDPEVPFQVVPEFRHICAI